MTLASLETDLHKIFANSQINKVNTRKEFFRLKLGDIKRVVEDRNIETHWTMKAEAMHYRESLTLSGVIYDDVGDYGAITE